MDGELIGGCDIVLEMYESGELAERLGVDMPEDEDDEPVEPISNGPVGQGADPAREPPGLRAQAASRPQRPRRPLRCCTIRRPRSA